MYMADLQWTQRTEHPSQISGKTALKSNSIISQPQHMHGQASRKFMHARCPYQQSDCVWKAVWVCNKQLSQRASLMTSHIEVAAGGVKGFDHHVSIALYAVLQK